MRFDLHVHSCLSPCGSLDMSPRAIAATARQRGLDGIAVVDHNSGLNAPAVQECCRGEGIRVLFGIEAMSREEAHVLCLFDRVEDVVRLSAEWYRYLPPRLNDPRRFGDQVVVNADSEIEQWVGRQLIGALDLSLEALARQVRQRDGLFVAAHVDRVRDSVISQLGFIPSTPTWDAVEVSARCPDEMARRLCEPLPWIRSSDAHQLAEIGCCWNEADLVDFSVPCLRRALRAGLVRPGPAAASRRLRRSGSGN